MSTTLGIDLGTTAIKVASCTGDGGILACVSRRYRAADQHRVEFPCIWAALCDAVGELRGSVDLDAIVAVGIASQANSVLLVDGHEAPLMPVHLWSGFFGEGDLDELHGHCPPERIAEVTGLTRLGGYCAAGILRFLQRTRPDLIQRAAAARLLPDLLVQRLCGGVISDGSLWSLAGLYDVHHRQFWMEGDGPMGLLGIPPEWLPALAGTDRLAGRLGAQPADALGLPTGIPVAVPVLDHVAAALVSGVDSPGVVSLSLGTALCITALSEAPPLPIDDGAICPHPLDDHRCFQLAWSGRGCGLLEQCRDRVAPGGDLGELIAEAAFGPPFTPAGGAMRAEMDLLAGEVRRLANALDANGGKQRFVAVGGGTRSLELVRFLAESLDRRIDQPVAHEAAVAGACLLARRALESIG